jgi:hypothetical protein
MIAQMRTVWSVAALVMAWGWALVAGVGGLVLLIHQGPWPVTNGWFAMFSGIAACPLTATLLKSQTHISVSGRVQFAVALLIILAGRVAVVVLLHRPFIPRCTGSCW